MSFESCRTFILPNICSNLLHLMRAIARAHVSTCAASLIHVKSSMCHFCLWHLLYVTLEWKKNEIKIKSIKLNNWSLFFNFCYTFVRLNVVLPFTVLWDAFFLERGLRVGVKLRLLKLTNAGVLIRCEGGKGGGGRKKIEKLMSIPPFC